MIGIIADSHDNVEALRKVVDIFNHKNVELVIHAGDIVAPFSVKPLNDLNCDVYAVYGNNDGEKKGLKKAFENVGTIFEPPVSIDLNGISAVLTHDLEKSGEFIRNSNPDLLIHGHTHEAETKIRNGIKFVNPGELGGWLNGLKQYAILKKKNLNVKIKELQ